MRQRYRGWSEQAEPERAVAPQPGPATQRRDPHDLQRRPPEQHPTIHGRRTTWQGQADGRPGVGLLQGFPIHRPAFAQCLCEHGGQRQHVGTVAADRPGVLIAPPEAKEAVGPLREKVVAGQAPGLKTQVP